ncbi:MAG: linear amide C-N hydrolase [Nitrospina sp.]|jgi:hypothetical protein|nr:linear amide C-N hydrolase [Nitrospina sp.]
MKFFRSLPIFVIFIIGLIACATPPGADELSLADKLGALNLSEEQVDTLLSLEQIDEFPLYSMHFYAPYETLSMEGGRQYTEISAFDNAWGCSLFAAFADPENMLFGRNFDWEFSPALLLFTDPQDGYASASMVDIKYLGFWHEDAYDIVDLPLAGRLALLDAPLIPFDGINEAGLAVGMAAVPDGKMTLDPDKETVNSLLVIREILDHAGDVDEAISILDRFNIDYGTGPALHYLIADANGDALLVEFYQGEMRLIHNQTDWHQATNFLISSSGDSPQGHCWRYDAIYSQLSENDGRISTTQAMGLLEDVAQGATQWSVVYDMDSGDIHIAMGAAYDEVHQLHLDLLSK